MLNAINDLFGCFNVNIGWIKNWNTNPTIQNALKPFGYLRIDKFSLIDEVSLISGQVLQKSSKKADQPNLKGKPTFNRKLKC